MIFEVQVQGRNKQRIEQEDPNSEFFSYLDTLLAEIDETAKDVSNTKTKVDTDNADTRIMGESIPATDIDQSLDSGLGKQDAAQIKQHAVYRMPRWAKVSFQVLMFEICGVKLGVPLVSLLGILEL